MKQIMARKRNRQVVLLDDGLPADEIYSELMAFICELAADMCCAKLQAVRGASAYPSPSSVPDAWSCGRPYTRFDG